MPERCVVFGCSDTAESAKGIYVYQIPFWGDNAPILVKRRKKWVDFVKRRRDKWAPTRSSVVCSKHFTEDCFEYGSATVMKYKTPRLKKDEHGVSVFPTMDKFNEGSSKSERTQRMSKRRKVSCILMFIRSQFWIIKVKLRHWNLHIYCKYGIEVLQPLIKDSSSATSIYLNTKIPSSDENMRQTCLHEMKFDIGSFSFMTYVLVCVWYRVKTNQQCPKMRQVLQLHQLGIWKVTWMNLAVVIWRQKQWWASLSFVSTFKNPNTCLTSDRH